MNKNKITTLEINLLLEAIKSRYGYDFSNYAKPSLRRRLEHNLSNAKLKHMSDMISKILHDEQFFNQLLLDLSVTVTDMFRDPDFYKEFRSKVVPILKSYPVIKIWHAGCATGEEVYSMAILLHEEDLLERSIIYATDFNTHSLDYSRDATYPLKDIKRYQQNYKNAGGKKELSDYYNSLYESIKFHDYLKKNITFSYHNLVIDRVFSEMNVILCRNVMIYFDNTLQDKVFDLFTDSLSNNGVLCLGNKESMDFSCVKDKYKPISKPQRIFKKIITMGQDNE